MHRFVTVVIQETPDAPLVPWFAVLMALWATFFLEVPIDRPGGRGGEVRCPLPMKLGPSPMQSGGRPFSPGVANAVRGRQCRSGAPLSPGSSVQLPHSIERRRQRMARANRLCGTVAQRMNEPSRERERHATRSFVRPFFLFAFAFVC